MFERFTDRARKVIALADTEAQHLNHEFLGTEHILLGIIEEGSGIAANVLRNLGVDLTKVRADVEMRVQSGSDPVRPGKRPYTPKTKKVLEMAIEEARSLGHNYVGTEHLLLGLLRERECAAALVLQNRGVRLGDVREEVINLIGDAHQIESISPAPDLAAQGEASRDRIAWVAKCREELRRIKPGMTRKEVEAALKEDVASQAPLIATFVHRDCPCFKIDVEFTSQDDKVIKVSKPYLDAPAKA